MSDGRLVLCEDERTIGFEPLALTRSVAQLRTGLWTHRERWERLFPERTLALACRGYLAETEAATGEWAGVIGSAGEADTLFVAAALGRPAPAVLAAIRELESGQALVAEGRFVAARGSGEAAEALLGTLREVAGDGPIPDGTPRPDWPALAEAAGLAVRDVEASAPRTLVDLLRDAPAAITEDFAAYVDLLEAPDPDAYPDVHFANRDRIRLSASVDLDPGVVLDAREGPILIGPDTRVMAGSVILGPVAIGAKCLIKPATRIYHGVCLGPVCKIGGEVDGTIVQGWANKQHDGFLGHSYLGAWVNLGAATDTSDLKNNYGPVRIVLNGQTVDTGSRNVGSLIGDHSKTGIHTMLNTGTVIGVSSNVFGGGFPPKAIPCFAWGGDGRWEAYRLDDALAVAEAVCARRGVDFGAAERQLLTVVHQETATRRGAWLER